MSESFDSIYAQLKERLGETEINVTTITTVVKFSMEVVEMTQLKGKQQKVMVEKLVRKVVEDAPISDEKEKFLLDMVDEGVVGNIIEMVISATKGELNLNAAVDTGKACCVGFLRFKGCKIGRAHV